MKNLKTCGNKLEDYRIKTVIDKFHGKDVESIHLTVVSEKVTYMYEICSDENHPLNVTKDRLEEELKNSKENYEKFEIKNDKKREYLSINNHRYTGRQLK